MRCIRAICGLCAHQSANHKTGSKEASTHWVLTIIDLLKPASRVSCWYSIGMITWVEKTSSQNCKSVQQSWWCACRNFTIDAWTLLETQDGQLGGLSAICSNSQQLASITAGFNNGSDANCLSPSDLTQHRIVTTFAAGHFNYRSKLLRCLTNDH